MGSIIIDETEFIDTMKKLKVEVSRDQEAYRLYNQSDIASSESKIRVMMLKYRTADDHASSAEYIKK